MTNLELFKIHQELCRKALNLMQKKNHDYAGKSGLEPFANFTRAEAMGITTTEKGMMVRLLDKMSRLSSFMDSGTFKVENEKLEDTILDVINYSILLHAYMTEKMRNNSDYDVVILKQNEDKHLGIINLEHNSEKSDPYNLFTSKGNVIPNTLDTI